MEPLHPTCLPTASASTVGTRRPSEEKGARSQLAAVGVRGLFGRVPEWG